MSIKPTMPICYAILAAVCYGISTPLSKLLLVKLNPVFLAALLYLGAGLSTWIARLVQTKKRTAQEAVLTKTDMPYIVGMVLLYILAQRYLGAARTSAYYAFAPFIGVCLAFLLHEQSISLSFVIALVMMGIGSYLISAEHHIHKHIHELMTHTHRHNHQDGHHNHMHPFPVHGEHSHEHTHERLEHTHEHTLDLHHTH